MSRLSSEVLTLPPEPGSARSARIFVRRQLRSWGCEELVDAAVLGVSELVTNAVVHTRDAVDLRLTWSEPRLRIELRDRSRSAAIGARTVASVGGHAPVEDGEGSVPESTSGRGLLIVASMAATVGERIELDGKTVWFELDAGRRDGAGPAAIVQQSLDGPAGAAPLESETARVVRLRDVPVTVAVASDDHLNDLTRELSLDATGPLAQSLLRAIAEIGGSFPYDTEWRERVRAARVFGNPRLDVEVRVDPERLAVLQGIVRLLDEAEAAMRSGLFLALPPPPTVRTFRRWAVEEMAAQLAGQPPGCPPDALTTPARIAGARTVEDLLEAVTDAAHSLRATSDADHAAQAEVLERGLDRLRRELEVRNRLLEEQSQVAAVLQASLRPETLPVIPGVAVTGRYRPGAAEVGGDFYDVFPLPGGYWGFIIGDVCGKGAPAAAKTALARHTLRTAAMLEEDPAVVLRTLNEALLQRGETESFCSALFARLCPEPGGARGEVAVAGHPRPLVRRASGDVERLAGGGALLGIVDDEVASGVPLVLRTGDVLVLYTDGVTEARRGHALFGEDRLVEVVAGAGGSVEDVARAVEDAVTAFGDDDRADDVALLLISTT